MKHPRRENKTGAYLRVFQQCYISVEYDENRATVTTAVKSSEGLQQELKARGFMASEIGLHGRFHHEWYNEDIQALVRYCDANEALCFPEASKLVYPTWCSNILSGVASGPAGSVAYTPGSLHEHAMRDILTYKSEWHKTFETAWASASDPSSCRVICFGPERCVPPSAMRKLGPRVLHVSDMARTESDTREKEELRPHPRITEDVAVVGMSIKVAGADDVDEFWDLLCQGSSQHQEVSEDRLSFDNVWREPERSRKWYGNFINDHDAFDLKFFKKSAREIASTDPQQRHMMQAAYQAVEQSGYFGFNAVDDKQKRMVGCFIGVCSADYENNMACYQPNAFTAVGNLKSFIAGKISHWFGWLGPSLCVRIIHTERGRLLLEFQGCDPGVGTQERCGSWAISCDQRITPAGSTFDS